VILSDSWQIAEAIAQMIAAVATVGAVVTSLYLARDTRRPRLHLALLKFPHPDGKEFPTLRVTNAGMLPVTVDGFGWYVGRIRKVSGADLLFARSTPLPRQLKAGESYAWFVSAEEFLINSPGLLSQLRYHHRRWWVGYAPRLQISLVTSTGDILTGTVWRDVVNWMVESAP
jgi:hypothetical protein